MTWFYILSDTELVTLIFVGHLETADSEIFSTVKDVWNIHILAFAASLQQQPYFKLCNSAEAHWFCLYWASGDCSCTMWGFSLSVCKNSLSSMFLTENYSLESYMSIQGLPFCQKEYTYELLNSFEVFKYWIWTDLDASCNSTAPLKHATTRW